jgi:hypothetical protein
MVNATGRAADRLTPALKNAAAIVDWRAMDWDLAIRQARRAGLLSRLEVLLAEDGLLAEVPTAAREHLVAARIVAQKHRSDVTRELRYISSALAGLDAPIILLKGASYVAAGLPPSHGRLFSDIDILVPKRALSAAEAALLAAGWETAKQDDYDQSYYRRWMHELPPLQHKRRRTTIDVHHTIVPPTSSHAIDARRMIDWAIPACPDSPFCVLSPVDMVLHAAVHLFDDGEFVNGLRDLDDINRLLRHFTVLPEFWDALNQRAESLRLERPLFYALRYAARYLETPVPPRILAFPANPPAPHRLQLMDGVFDRALRPAHASCGDRLSGLAAQFLYLRAHCLRMPMRLLLPHLLRKAVTRRLKPAEA